jgi:hypothetical protein
VDTQGINIHSHLIKISLDCVSDCSGNITVGFAHHQWNGEQVPVVKGEPLESIISEGSSMDENEKRPGLKILGWMLLTLVLVMLAIRLGDKIGNIFDVKMQEERMNSLK